MATIRQQILIDAGVRSVWNAITTPEGITRWWSTGARVDGREGGRVSLTHGEGEEMIEERGIVHRFRPTATFEILWDSTGPSPSRATSVQFQIGRGAGETKVHLQVGGGGVLDDEEARAALEEVWKARLLRLRETLES